MMRIRLNGEDREIPEASTIADLLAALGLRRDGVAVAVNRRVVPRSRHAEHALAAGDEVEVIQAVGGG